MLIQQMVRYHFLKFRIALKFSCKLEETDKIALKNKFLLYIKNLEYLCHLVILINNDGNMYNEYG